MQENLILFSTYAFVYVKNTKNATNALRYCNSYGQVLLLNFGFGTPLSKKIWLKSHYLEVRRRKIKTQNKILNRNLRSKIATEIEQFSESFSCLIWKRGLMWSRWEVMVNHGWPLVTAVDHMALGPGDFLLCFWQNLERAKTVFEFLNDNQMFFEPFTVLCRFLTLLC